MLIDPCPVRPASGRNTGKRSLGGAGELAAQVCGGALTRIGVVFVGEVGQLPGALIGPSWLAVGKMAGLIDWPAIPACGRHIQ